MSSDQLIPNRPKQKRSIKRFEKILNTVEEILITEGIHAITIKEIARKAKNARFAYKSKEMSPRLYRTNLTRKYKFQKPNPESLTCYPSCVVLAYKALIIHA